MTMYAIVNVEYTVCLIGFLDPSEMSLCGKC